MEFNLDGFQETSMWPEAATVFGGFLLPASWRPNVASLDQAGRELGTQAYVAQALTTPRAPIRDKPRDRELWTRKGLGVSRRNC